MPILEYDLLIDQGADFSATPIWSAGGTPVVYTGATASLMVRQNPSDAAPLLNISTTASANGSIVFGPVGTIPAGGIQINITAAGVALLPTAAPAPQYDLVIAWTNGTKTAFASGAVRVKPTNNH